MRTPPWTPNHPINSTFCTNFPAFGLHLWTTGVESGLARDAPVPAGAVALRQDAVTHELLNHLGRLKRIFVSPDPDNQPAHCGELSSGIRVPANDAAELQRHQLVLVFGR
jgi:hypothetical protein